VFEPPKFSTFFFGIYCKFVDVERFSQGECEEKGRECELILGIGFCGFFQIYVEWCSSDSWVCKWFLTICSFSQGNVAAFEEKSLMLLFRFFMDGIYKRKK